LHACRSTLEDPLYNPQTQRYLIEMAALLARHESGTIVPLAIAVGRVHMDDPRLNAELKECQLRLQGAVEISQEFEVEASPAIRIDDDVALGISRTSREKNATVVVMGWSRTTGLRARLFGNVIDSVFWSSHCPVIVTRLLNSPTTIQHILVPVGDLTLQTIRAIRFAQIVADVNQAEVVLLHVCDRRTPREQVAIFESQLFEIASFRNLQLNTNIRTIAADDVAKIIIREAKAFDIVILRSTRYRTAGGLAVSEVTTEVIGELNCSMVLLGEPHS
jgi:Universal stress protein family.